MPHNIDDPRQILTILNSLGFVGITAEQLKSFIKDLKLYRKIKENHHEQWREETKKKIFSKQRQALAELINSNSNHNITIQDSSIVEIKVKRVTESNTNNELENNQELFNQQLKNKKFNSSKRDENENTDVIDNKKKESIIEPTNMLNNINKYKYRIIPKRAVSAPEFAKNISRSHSRSKSVTSDTLTQGNQSTSSARSQAKSFIRPWKLHPEIHRPPHNINSDPVLLYQQYQKEWKQKLMPGENRHTGIRWAVREKMLGVNPTPKPILKKSCSSINIKKR